MENNSKLAFFWHRRDLRIHDNHGLSKALSSGLKVIPLFIFDTSILSKLPPDDQRVLFIYKQIERLKNSYAELGSDLKVYHGNPLELIPQLCKEHSVEKVYSNRDYEPKAIERDVKIFDALKKINCDLIGAKDHVIFEKNEVIKDDGKPYTVFTPYSNKWKKTLTENDLTSFKTEKNTINLFQTKEKQKLVSIESLGFKGIQTVEFPKDIAPEEIIQHYSENRDYPAKNGTSRLGVHLRFGTISIRELATIAKNTNETFLNELIWRDFYQMIIYHFPNTSENAFKPIYDRIAWSNNEAHFKAWCDGKTGYPLVDAGMRELNATGHMHNRVRMVVASFLTKHLLIDWRWGANYFAEKLLDFELASNAGGWQWAAGSGCDAAPYFRIFNPKLQLEKFDKHLIYTKKWVPEFGTKTYPTPIVEHATVTKHTIEVYKQTLNNL
jgi:deoxyribodipyrimidine photo-lyase